MIYPYKCAGCGATQDVHQRLAAYIASPAVPMHCGSPMQRVFTVPMMAADYQTPFVSHIDGTVINSRSQQREHMARHGVVLYDDFVSELPAKRAAVQAEAVKDIKSDIDEAITKVVQGYVPEHMAATEDVNGIDVLQTHALPKELKSEVTVEV